MSDIISSALDIADEMKIENTEKAKEIIDEIFEKINITDYDEIDQSVFVMVGVRKGRDVYSHGGAYEIRGSQGYSEYDVYKFKSNANNMCDGIIDDLISE